MSPVIYPTTNFTATEQLCLTHGEGIYVYDSDGNKYIEGLASLWCTSLGYSNTEVIDAITTQLNKLPFSHTFGGKTHAPIMELADKLRAMVPVEDAYFFFGNSGSDANDSHYKMLRYYFNAIGKPEKRKIITRERGYHGVTVAAGSMTSLPANLAHFDAPLEALGVLRAESPHYYTNRKGNETEAQFVDRIIQALEDQILAEGPDTIAAMIVEPITGASGVIVPPEGYYEKLQAILRKHGILVWADEVICGFGRTGNWFGSQTLGIKPHIMTIAKGLSSGYQPIGGSVVCDEVAEVIGSDEFNHGYTYSGHPVAAAVAIENIKLLKSDNIIQNVAINTGPYLQQRWQELAEHPLVGEARCVGFIGALELVKHTNPIAFFDKPGKVGTICRDICVNNGLVMRATDDTMLISPPLIMTHQHIDELIDKAKRCLDLTLKAVF